MATATSYTKAGIDAKAAPLTSADPLAPGVPTAGTSGEAARADHVHPPAPSGFTSSAPGSAASGMWFCPLGGGFTGGTSGNYRTLGSVLPVHRRMTLTSIYIRFSTAADAGTATLAIYAVSPATGMPVGDPLAVATGIDDTTLGNKVVTLPSPLTLEVGLYMLQVGGVGFTTTRPQMSTLHNPYAAAEFLPYRTNEAFYPPAYSLANFNNSTGAWPTLTGAASDFELNLNANGTFGYAIRGTLPA